jgi:acyl carrier protein
MDATARAKLLEIIAVELQLPTASVSSGLSLRKDLGMDSVAALNILFAAEEAFGVRIPEGELEHVDDVDAIVALIERHRVVEPARVSSRTA